MGSLRAVLAVGAVCVLSAPTQAAFLGGLTVQPSNPVAGDSVMVTASGWFPDACWDAQVSHECARVGDAVTITFQTVDRWVPGMLCPLVIQDFAGSCQLGELEIGTYVVNVIENASSARSLGPLVRQFSFQVNTAVTTEAPAWSTLKARFGRVRGVI